MPLYADRHRQPPNQVSWPCKMRARTECTNAPVPWYYENSLPKNALLQAKIRGLVLWGAALLCVTFLLRISIWQQHPQVCKSLLSLSFLMTGSNL